jgi:hypothetical protein
LTRIHDNAMQSNGGMMKWLTGGGGGDKKNDINNANVDKLDAINFNDDTSEIDLNVFVCVRIVFICIYVL